MLMALGVSAVLAACASGGGSGDSSSSSRRSSGTITVEELADHSTVSAMDAIRRLRPRWLRARGGGTPMVIFDGARHGVSILENIRASDVESISLMSASDATTRYGTNFPNGAIVVNSRN